jgi:hypothetical protein
MLEHSNVLIRRVGEGWEILDPETSRSLGLARCRPARTSWGVAWLQRATVDVFEADEEPLVFTVRRLWGLSPKWEICDADGNRVALVHRGRILDTFGRHWATIESTSDGINFCARDRQFAQARRTTNGLHMSFAPDLHEHPLTKMSLLGAILATGRDLFT